MAKEDKIVFCTGGGCTAKLGAGVLSHILEKLPRGEKDPDLLVGYDRNKILIHCFLKKILHISICRYSLIICFSWKILDKNCLCLFQIQIRILLDSPEDISFCHCSDIFPCLIQHWNGCIFMKFHCFQNLT